ncbi:MAG: hypothetical protein V3S17_03590 [candidate division Zixibacteria bacterium]
MTRRIPLVLIFSLLLIAVTATSVFSAKEAGEKKRNNHIFKVMRDYAMPMEYPTIDATAPQDGDNPQVSLGISGRTLSPGAVIGNTYYDYQTNNRMQRHTTIGRNFDSGLNDTLTLIHAAWMDLPGPSFAAARTAGYAAYSAADGAYKTEVNLTFNPEYCGYFSLAVTPDNRAIIAGHWNPTTNSLIYKSTVWYDEADPGDGGFGIKNVVPAALSDWKNPYAVGSGDENVIWPTVAFQVRPTGETVTHVAGVTYSGGGASHVGYYFRREGASGDTLGSGSLSSCFIAGEIDPVVQGWDCPWVFDTLHSTSETLEASTKSGKVALFWTANLPEPGCDTCSINADLGFPRSRFFNDVYYNISDDYGVTWNPRVNASNFDTLTEDWGPWNDIAGLWVGDAPNEEFHLAWVARDIGRYLDEGGGIAYAARVYHWAESFPDLSPPLGPRVAMASQIDNDTCSPGSFNANLGKVTMATCAGNIYISAVDLHDGHNGDPANPDCSERGYGGGAGVDASANGEIVLVISDNNGVSFDLPHNLTNSPTPHCDKEGGLVGPCDSDHWASLAPYGIATLSGDDFSSADTVLPRPVSYPDVIGAEWLHITYVNDLDPGFVGMDNSTWTNSPVRHFRIACVNPDQIPVPIYEYSVIQWPNYVKPDSIKDTTLTITNSGNAMLNILVTTEEDTGPPGWLSTSGFAAQIPDGAGNVDTGTITFDATGISQAKINSAGGHIVVRGRIFFDHDGPSDIDTIEVTLIVTDTVLITTWDTISTDVISLAVATNGRYGGGGAAGIEGVRMDYWFDPAECDTFDSIVGNTKVYLYDGSFVVGGPVEINGGLDTIMANEIFSQGPRNFTSVYSLDGPSLVTDGMLQTWSSGKMTNHDSSLAFHVTYYAPQVTATYVYGGGNKFWYADQQFITKSLKIWSNDGLDHANLAIGDAIDWDIPADDSGANQTGSNNKGEVNSALGLISFIGAEFNVDTVLDDGTVQECQENDTRFGGMAYSYTNYFTDSTNKWTTNESLYGGYAEANARYVYTGWDESELYFNMSAASGLIPWIHPHPDSSKTDLHGVLTYEFEYNLLAGDTLVVFSVLATVQEDLAGPGRIEDLADKGRNFTHYFGCCRGLRGDLNYDNKDATVLDLTFAVDRIFRGGGPALCDGEGDVNGDKDVLTVLDLVYLVDRIFRGGDAPPSCGTAPS